MIARTLQFALAAGVLLGTVACFNWPQAPAGAEASREAGSASPSGVAPASPVEEAPSARAAGNAARGGRPIVAIGPVGVAAKNISCEGWERRYGDCNAELAAGFRAMLETAIVRTGKMDVMERMEWDAIVAERGLDESGITDRPSGLGGLTGVDYYVYGAITRFGALGRGMVLPNTTVRRSSVETEMGVDVKVADTSTGRIVLADSVTATVTRSSRSEVGGIVRATGTADPFADVQAALAAKVAAAVVTSRIPIKVIDVEPDGALILNYGESMLRPGDRFAAFAVGRSYVDPDTGQVLGARETEVGAVEVVVVEPMFAAARVVAGEVGEGAVLKRARRAPPEASAPKKKKRSELGGARW